MNFSKVDILKLRRLYNDAVVNGDKSFNFRGSIILTQYAKYLLEHIDAQTIPGAPQDAFKKLKDNGYYNNKARDIL